MLHIPEAQSQILTQVLVSKLAQLMIFEISTKLYSTDQTIMIRITSCFSLAAVLPTSNGPWSLVAGWCHGIRLTCICDRTFVCARDYHIKCNLRGHGPTLRYFIK